MHHLGCTLRYLSLCILLALTGGLTAAELSEPIVKYDLATLPDTQFDNWAKGADADGTQYRVVSGKSGAARLKAWWKDGELRPSEGDWYTLEVKYKDVLSKPAQFDVHSGVGWGLNNSPLHQFGGANDGKWKTANIPAPWDMVARLVNTVDPAQNHPEMTSFRIGVPADLPIASIVVRKAVPEDEARFYAETRALIAREQADLRAKTPVPAAKTPPQAGGPIAAYPWDANFRLFQNYSVPTAELGKAVKVRMCQNQLEGGSFGVFANTALSGVDYEVTPLVDAAGKTLKATIDRRTAEYSLLDGKWTPMRLWPAYAVDIAAGHSQWFYFNVETKRGETQPGLYKGKILIQAKEAKTELPLEVEVLPVDLLTIGEAGVTMFGCYAATPPLHDIEFERRYNYSGALLWYKPGMFSMPLALQDGKLKIDFTFADDWMKGARQRGFTGAIWYLGGDPFKMPRSLNLIGQLGTLDKKLNMDQWCAAQNKVEHVLPETRKLLVDWMRQVNAHALENNWLELFPTPHDEPQKWASAGAWIKPFFKDACAAIREADPRIRIYGCIHHVAGWHGIPDLWKIFIDDIDVFNTNNVYEDMDVGNKVRAYGAECAKKGGREKLFWQYTGLGGGVPDSQRYSFGFFFGSFGSTGCTAWAYNWGSWELSGRNGDLAVTGWPTAYQTIPSPWMEAQREGLDDRRIIATYQKRFANDPEAMQVLAGVFKEARAKPKARKYDAEAGFYDSVDDASKLVRWRETLLARLAKQP